MRTLIIGILLLICSKNTGQTNHIIGVGVGIYNSSVPNIELQYTLLYKTFAAKLNTMYLPAKNYYFNNLSQSSVLVGLNKRSNKISMHTTAGVRYMYPWINYSSKIPKDEQLSPQITFCVNIGMNIHLSDKNIIYIDNYIGSHGRNASIGHHKAYIYQPDFSAIIGYSYRLN